MRYINLKNRIQFDVIGKPYGQKRPRAVRRGGFISMYSPKENVDYSVNVVNAYLQAIGGLKIGKGYQHTTYGKKPLVIEIQAYFKKPKISKKQEALNLIEDRFPGKKPDSDNIAKSILDSLNKVAYDDDACVVSLSVDKFYCYDNMTEERVNVVIYEKE